MTTSPYLTENDDEDYTEDEDEQSDNEMSFALNGLAQSSLPYRSRHVVSTRPLQERSPNIQVDTFARTRGPLLKQDIPSAYGHGRETQLTNKAGDFVLKYAQFYQLTALEHHNYEILRALAITAPKYVRNREKERGDGAKRRGTQDVWDDVREELFFKGTY